LPILPEHHRVSAWIDSRSQDRLSLEAARLMRSPGGRFWIEARNACWSGFPPPAFAGTGPAGMTIMGRNRVGVG